MVKRGRVADADLLNSVEAVKRESHRNMRYASVDEQSCRRSIPGRPRPRKSANWSSRQRSLRTTPIAAADLAPERVARQITARRKTITSVRGDAELAESQLHLPRT